MFILNHKNSIANHFLAELRDTSIQLDRLRFRKNLERLGEIMAYEVSKDLGYETHPVQTPLKETTTELLLRQPVVVPVFRAAMPFFQGILNFFDKADCGFVGAYRREEDNKVEIEFGYMAAPGIQEKEVILVDPMLATGKSFLESIDNLLINGTPSIIHIVAVIASPEGIEYIERNLQVPHKLWVCSLDEGLNEKFYIVPGLGDAGDLAYGPKL